MKPCLETKEYIVGMLAVLFSVLSGWFIIPKIVSFINPVMIDVPQVKNLFIDFMVDKVCPEPVERTTFLVAVVISPILLLVFISIFNYFFKNITNLSVIKHSYSILFIVFLGLIAYLAWISNEMDHFFYFYNGIGIGLKAIFFVVFTSLLLNLLILSAKKNNVSNNFLRILSFITNSVCWIIIICVVLLCVYDIGLVSDMGTYSAHFNVVFNPVVQVFFGKQILYNLTSVYGLYPHILEPIWRIIGLSVFKFTLIMGLLMGISLVLLYKLFKELIDNKIIGYLSFISLIWYVYMYGRVIFMYRWPPEFIDAYFQFAPLRLLFPVFSLYFTYYYLKTYSKRIYYLSFVIYSISIFWNFDVGFVVYLAWLLVLIYEGLCNKNIKDIFFHIINWVIVFSLTIASFTLYMYLRYGHLPVYGEFLMFQKIFYIYGYVMLPMPLIHPWNLVTIIYLIGMTISLINLLKGNKSPKVSMIFNLSILGIGIFSYYQGRSHNFNLVAICYPAIILVTIFADELIKKAKDDKSILNFVALNYITFFIIYSSINLIINYKIIFTTIKERIGISIKRENTPVIRSAEFIKNNTKRGDEVPIISNLCGIYYLESQTTSPIKAEPRELVMVSEMDEMLDYLKSSSCKKVILDANFKEEKAVWDFVQRNFKLVLVSPDRNVGIFEK